MLSSTIDVGKGTSYGASGASSMVMRGVLRERDKLFTRPGEEVRKKDGLVEEIVRSAAGGIGVISEALHHRKEKKAKDLQQSQEPSHTQFPSETVQSPPGEAVPDSNKIVDEKATTGEEEESRSQKDQKDSGNLATAFINRHACLPGNRAANGRELPLPVILPQRRPEKRARGFLRAYAPLLADVGIEENTFLDFIDTFNKALEPNPWINALNLAGFAGSAMPEPASMLFGFGVEYATEAALEGHSRYSSNVFLDRVNSQFFNPRGLVCLVVTWQPDISNNQLNVNFEGEVSASRPNPGVSERIGDIAAQRTSAKDGWQSMKGQMAEMMKMSNGNFNWPEPAPLVFPAAKDPLTESGSDDCAKKKNALDRMEIWMEDMSDKRAQAKWADENSDKPAASLMPNHEFRSRYADPNHPAASGDLVALITGGRWTYVGKKKDKKSKKDRRSKEEEEQNNGEGLKRVADSDNPGTDNVSKVSDSVKEDESSGEDERDERLKKEQKEKRKEEEKKMKKEKKEKENKEKERKEMEKREKREREKNEKKAKKGNDDKKSKHETDNSKPHEDHEGDGSKEDDDDKSFQRDDNSQVSTKEDKDNEAWEPDTDSGKLQKDDGRKAKDEKKARKEKEKADKIAKKKKAKEEDWLSSLFQKDVLYLVVINLPSEQQVAAATEARVMRI
ncbi:FAD binding domain protein [Colletotrichum higginsianum IMI 349063]|uniref:FAD binding domain protein n=1 Tax=Colletotrichum higginsianum (strain IMI 349063) TaxID=759273 RepID=A0A1B7YHG9_COLHI|nr:FAD binding domain protein [Colletotrichum higginsianum IMI 349063]OBR11527.1 FAD binding domain protein [Colletotrichum higginsianum IMI 349063]